MTLSNKVLPKYGHNNIIATNKSNKIRYRLPFYTKEDQAKLKTKPVLKTVAMLVFPAVTQEMYLKKHCIL